MKIPVYLFTAVVGYYAYLLPNLSLADQEIDFSDEAVAKNILLDKTWFCYVYDKTDPGYVTWKFTEIRGKKVRGTVVSGYCPGTGILKGKLKKNTLKYSVNALLPCDNTAGTLRFEDNMFAGMYRHTSGLVGRTTKIECEAAPEE